MTAHLTVLASLGVAILLSPEILILGLIMACDKRAPRFVAWMYAIGASIGLGMGLVIGFLVAPAPHAESAPHAPTWTEFAVRAVIAAILLTVGVQRAVGAMRKAPIEGEAEAEGRAHEGKKGLTTRVKAWFKSKFPGFGASDLPLWRRATRSALLGFATMGIHPKSVGIAIAAGHQALQISGDQDRTFGILVFAVISMLPAIAPAVIETAHSGASTAIKESSERFLKTNGRWISAVILLGAGAYVAWNAAHEMPGRTKSAETAPVESAPAAVAPKA